MAGQTGDDEGDGDEEDGHGSGGDGDGGDVDDDDPGSWTSLSVRRRRCREAAAKPPVGRHGHINRLRSEVKLHFNGDAPDIPDHTSGTR